MKEEGIKVEIQKELMYNMMQAHAALNNDEAVNSTKKDLVKFLFPETKDQEESLMEEAQRRIMSSGTTLRLSADPTKKLDPNLVNQQFNKV